MKRLITILALLTLPMMVLAGEFEDKVVEIYKTEFTQYLPTTCDGTNSKGYIYEGQLNDSTYNVYRLIMRDKVEFLMVMDSMSEEYFYIVSEEGEVSETHHADWDAQLADASPNFFAIMHNGTHDCQSGLTFI